jgi:hypothetical protein
MSSMLRLTLAALATGMALAPVVHAAGKPPVALVLEVSGSTVEPFSEMRPGDRIPLAEDGQVEFLHYGTCQTVVVRGGELSFSDERYTVRQGKVVDVKRAKCPAEATLRGETQLGGAVLRNTGSAGFTMAPAASFLLVGPGRAKVTAVTVRQGDKVVMQQPMRGARFTWPAGTPPLQPETAYVLELSGAGTPKLEFKVAPVSANAPLPLVRVE